MTRGWLLAAALLASPGCIVAALHPFYADTAIVFDERLLGGWQSAEDNVTVTVERGDWRSYRVLYEYPTDKRTLSGYLFKVGDQHYLDLAPLRGEDPGAFLLTGHALVRLSIADGELRVAPLDYDALTKAMASRAAPAELLPVHAERGQIALTADRLALERWLKTVKPDSPIWSEETILKKVRSQK